MLKVDKLETKFVQGHFVVYLKNTIGYQFYLPTKQIVVISTNAIFLEREFIQDKGNFTEIDFNEVIKEKMKQIRMRG